MKKFISMLAGVVMASSLFAVSAYAANVTATADKTEVNVGDKIVVTIDTAKKNIAADSFWLSFDPEYLTVVDIKDDYGYSVNGVGADAALFQVNYEAGRDSGKYTYQSPSVANSMANKAVGFAYPGGSAADYLAKNGFATIEFVAAKEGNTTMTLVEASTGGTNGYKGDSSVINVTVKGNEPPVDNNNYGTAGNEFEGKATKYWTVNYEAGAFTGTDVITLKEKDSDKTATINVTTTDDFDIAGAVSFYVYVIGNDIANVYIVE